MKWVWFAAASLLVLLYSWKYLLTPRTIGFWRFFAFEALLGITWLNVPYWFHDPFVPRQIVSWLLLIGSIPLALAGFLTLHSKGRPRRGIEDTSILVTHGVYRLIRHPLYTSLLMLGWGIFLKHVSWPSAALALVISAALYLTARVEESESLARFGEEYAAYMRRARMFIPFLF